METARKITVEVPEDLLEKAQRASGTGITQTGARGCSLSRLPTLMLAFGSFGEKFVFRRRQTS